MLSNMLNDLAEAMKALDGKKADFLHFGASDFPSKNTFKKCFKIVFFFALASRSGFGAAISDAVARSSIVFCNSVSADRNVMAALRLLGHSSTGKCFVQALWYEVLLGSALCKLCGTK